MPRRLDSVNQGGFVEAIDIDEGELEAVIGMLGLTDARQSEIARGQVYAALEDYETARSRTANAKKIREDLRDLEHLAEITNPDPLTAPLRRVLDAAESIRSDNPVLDRRMKLHFQSRQLRDWMTAIQEAEEAIFAIGRKFSVGLRGLMDNIDSEDGRGRRRDVAAFKFGLSLYGIWCEFTPGHTSRQNAFGRESDPFGDFVDAAGKLIDPDFNGHYVARLVHEAHRQPRSGEK